jgi:broad specificity phosphatase PhoE
VMQTVQEILVATEAERLIVVTHSGVCSVLGLRALGLGYTGKRTFGNENCALHTIAIAGEHWRAVVLNDVTHLGQPPCQGTPLLSLEQR